MPPENERPTSDRARTHTTPSETVGDSRLCAWATSSSSCRVQTSDPEIAKKLAKFPDCRRVGYSVRGPWVRLFSLPYTLDWVRRNVVAKLTPDFPRKFDDDFSENARDGVLEPILDQPQGLPLEAL